MFIVGWGHGNHAFVKHALRSVTFPFSPPTTINAPDSLSFNPTTGVQRPVVEVTSVYAGMQQAAATKHTRASYKRFFLSGDIAAPISHFSFLFSFSKKYLNEGIFLPMDQLGETVKVDVANSTFHSIPLGRTFFFLKLQVLDNYS